MVARMLHRFNRIAQTLPETDRNQNVFRSQHLDFILQAAATANRRFSVEAEREQTIREVIRKRAREIQTHH